MNDAILLLIFNKCAYAHIYSSLLHVNYSQVKFSMLLSGIMLNLKN